MPILARETDIFPNDLLSGEAPRHDQANCWWALYTRSRREKDLMRRLRAMGIFYYGPLIPNRTCSPAGRIRTSYIPLFPNYVFLNGDNTSRYKAMTTKCISRCISVPEGEPLREELRNIRRLIESGLPLHAESKLQPGRRVRIRTGGLRGQEGVLIKRHGKRCLLVAVGFLQQGASVLLDDYNVELLDKPTPS